MEFDEFDNDHFQNCTHLFALTIKAILEFSGIGNGSFMEVQSTLDAALQTPRPDHGQRLHPWPNVQAGAVMD